MRRFVLRVAVLAVAGLLAAPLFSAAAEVPIPVEEIETEGSGVGSWDGGIYVQPVQRGRGPILECLIHVQTTVDGIGETMTAVDQGEVPYTAEVGGIFLGGETALAGRATFTVAPATTLSISNADISLSAFCPGNQVPN